MEYWGRRDSREPVEYKWTRGGTRIRSGSAHHKFQLFSWPTFFSFFFWLHLALKDSPGSWVIAPGPPNLSFSIPFDQREAVRTVSTKEKNISNDTADILLHSAFQAKTWPVLSARERRFPRKMNIIRDQPVIGINEIAARFRFNWGCRGKSSRNWNLKRYFSWILPRGNPFHCILTVYFNIYFVFSFFLFFFFVFFFYDIDIIDIIEVIPREKVARVFWLRIKCFT